MTPPARANFYALSSETKEHKAALSGCLAGRIGDWGEPTRTLCAKLAAGAASYSIEKTRNPESRRKIGEK